MNRLEAIIFTIAAIAIAATCFGFAPDLMNHNPQGTWKYLLGGLLTVTGIVTSLMTLFFMFRIYKPGRIVPVITTERRYRTIEKQS